MREALVSKDFLQNDPAYIKGKKACCRMRFQHIPAERRRLIKFLRGTDIRPFAR